MITSSQTCMGSETFPNASCAGEQAGREKAAIHRALGGWGAGGTEVEGAQGVVLQLLWLQGFGEKKFGIIPSLCVPSLMPFLCYNEA